MTKTLIDPSPLTRAERWPKQFRVRRVSIEVLDRIDYFDSFQMYRETPDSLTAANRYLHVMEAVGQTACYLAEWYLPELTEQSVDEIVARLDAAAASLSDEGTPVQLLVTLSVPTDEVLYGVFGAHSQDIVSRTCMQAGAPHQRLSAQIGTRIRNGHP